MTNKNIFSVLLLVFYFVVCVVGANYLLDLANKPDDLLFLGGVLGFLLWIGLFVILAKNRLKSLFNIKKEE